MSHFVIALAIYLGTLAAAHLWIAIRLVLARTLNNGPDQLADRAGLGDFDSIHSRPNISGAAQDHV